AELALRRGETERLVRLRGEALTTEGDGVGRSLLAVRRDDALWLAWDDGLHEVRRCDPLATAATHSAHAGGLAAPLNASVARLLVAPGQVVAAGAPLLVLEAMKMEHLLRAPHAGTVKALHCAGGELVAEG